MEELRVLKTYSDEYAQTDLVEFEPGIWEVLTYKKVNGELILINNTGVLDSYPETVHWYGLHLDLYYGKTLEEIEA